MGCPNFNENKTFSKVHGNHNKLWKKKVKFKSKHLTWKSKLGTWNVQNKNSNKNYFDNICKHEMKQIRIWCKIISQIGKNNELNIMGVIFVFYNPFGDLTS